MKREKGTVRTVRTMIPLLTLLLLTTVLVSEVHSSSTDLAGDPASGEQARMASNERPASGGHGGNASGGSGGGGGVPKFCPGTSLLPKKLIIL